MRDIRIDRENSRIVMTRKFAMKADNPTTKEFRLLQEVMASFPHYSVENHKIKKNPNKECYKGLTYNYMREYITKYETADKVESALAELDDKIFKSKCHTIRYAHVKKWFLESYPSVDDFKKTVVEERTKAKVSFPILDEAIA